MLDTCPLPTSDCLMKASAMPHLHSYERRKPFDKRSNWLKRQYKWNVPHDLMLPKPQTCVPDNAVLRALEYPPRTDNPYFPMKPICQVFPTSDYLRLRTCDSKLENSVCEPFLSHNTRLGLEEVMHRWYCTKKRINSIAAHQEKVANTERKFLEHMTEQCLRHQVLERRAEGRDRMGKYMLITSEQDDVHGMIRRHGHGKKCEFKKAVPQVCGDPPECPIPNDPCARPETQSTGRRRCTCDAVRTILNECVCTCDATQGPDPNKSRVEKEVEEPSGQDGIEGPDTDKETSVAQEVDRRPCFNLQRMEERFKHEPVCPPVKTPEDLNAFAKGECKHAVRSEMHRKTGSNVSEVQPAAGADCHSECPLARECFSVPGQCAGWCTPLQAALYPHQVQTTPMKTTYAHLKKNLSTDVVKYEPRCHPGTYKHDLQKRFLDLYPDTIPDTKILFHWKNREKHLFTRRALKAQNTPDVLKIAQGLSAANNVKMGD